MKIDDIEQLEQVLDLMHRKACHTMIVGDVTIQVHLSPIEHKQDQPKRVDEFIDPATGLPMTEDELLLYSSFAAAEIPG